MIGDSFGPDGMDGAYLREDPEDAFTEEAADPEARARAAEEAFAALEEALDFLHPRESAADTVARLRRRFVTPEAFFEAPQHVLEAAGLGRRDALLFSLMPSLTRYMDRARFGKHPRLRNLGAASDFAVALYTGLAIEHFYLLCLDASGRLIECILLQSGSEDSAPFYLKDALMEVVRTRAKAVVISHNHPSFSARPSQADLNCTLALLGALQPIGCMLLDHLIVSGRTCVSLREHGFLRQHIWLDQNPKSTLLNNWLKE